MRAGIVGFPGSGKRTLFGLLAPNASAAGGRSARVGVLRVPDPRLETLARLHGSKKTTPATIEIVLLPAIRKGGADSARTLGEIRDVDLVLHVVGAFDGEVGPGEAPRVAADLELELLLADLGIVERRIERLDHDRARGKKEAVPGERDRLARALALLEAERPLRDALEGDERRRLGGYGLLTLKPKLLVLNVGEEDASLAGSSPSDADAGATARVSARIEAEIAELPEPDAEAFRADLGISRGAADRIVQAAFELMDRTTFFTTGPKETRAWVTRKGARADQAAGAIHSDMEAGFIRAEVAPYPTVVEHGSWDACRRNGALRLEGRNYLVRDGDVLVIRHAS